MPKRTKKLSLYKSTIVIWSEFNPKQKQLEIDQLAREAIDGEAYCSKQETKLVKDAKADPDWDGTEFFDTSAEWA